MSVKLYYNDLCLGALNQYNYEYIWTPNDSGIKTAIIKYPMGMEMFFLPIYTTKYKVVPYHFSEFLSQALRPDLARKAHISPADSDFEKLYKLSKLKYFFTEFVIKS